jgi:hypothetical protein
MKKAVGAVTLLVLAGFTAVPTYTAELRVTGFFDNLFPTAHVNSSTADGNLTNNKDSEFYGRERGRFFFNFIASDDLRGVFALEIDQAYGAPSRNQFGSRCVPDAANATTISGLDLHLLGIYGHLHQPFGMDLTTGTAGSFTGVQNGPTNITTESRYYLGFDSRYRLGDLSIEPTFIYLLGTRKFTSASAAVTGFNDTSYRAFETQLNLQYTRGPWFLAAKGAYHSGNKAGDDINNQGFPGTKRSNVKVFFPMGIDGFHRFGEYLEILGRQEADGGISLLLNGSPGERGTFDEFGLIVGVGKAEYNWTDRLILEGAVGTMWSAEKTGCPAVLRTRSGACSTTGATTATGVTFNPWNFTGNSRHLGEEIDVGFRYTIMPGLIWQQRFGWAFLGDGFQIMNRHVQDSWVFTNRLLYTF